jgi:hypothetical protein
VRLIGGLQVLIGATRTRVGRAVLIGVVALIIAIVGGVLSLSYNGFCFRQQRFLSDDEYFDATIDQIIRGRTFVQTTSGPGFIRSVVLNVIPYTDKDEFRRRNPNCCKIVPHNVGDQGPFTSFRQRLFGYAANIVSVTYIVHYVGKNGDPESTMTTVQYAVTNCGRAWNATH